MRYAKLIHGEPRFAPNPVMAGANRVGNPPDSVCLELGFKPVMESPYPAEPAASGFRWELRWTESEEAIAQNWVQLPEPPDEELSGEEALRILLGGEDL